MFYSFHTHLLTIQTVGLLSEATFTYNIKMNTFEQSLICGTYH